MLTSGLNFRNAPKTVLTSGVSERTTYSDNFNIFGSLKIDATILNPGISLGFEATVSGWISPQFNVSITKVFDVERIGEIFGKITPLR